MVYIEYLQRKSIYDTYCDEFNLYLNTEDISRKEEEVKKYDNNGMHTIYVYNLSVIM